MSKLTKFTKGIAAVGVACSMLLFPVTGASAAEKLRMVTSLPAPSFLYKDIISVWAKNVTDASNGTLDVEVFPAGALGRDPASHLDMVSSGVADIGYIVAGYTPGAFPETTVMELPGVIPSATVGSVAGAMMVEEGLFKGVGMDKVKILGMFSTAPTLLHTTSKVETLDEVKGMRLRGAGPQLLHSIEALGATPVGGITSSNLSEALSRGLVAGSVNEWVAATIFGVIESAKFHLDVNMGTSPIMVVMNKAKYDALSDEQKAAIDKNAGEAFSRLWGEQFDGNNEKFRAKTLEDPSQQMVTLSPEEKAKWEARLQTVVDSWIEQTPNGQQIFDKYSEAVAAASQ
ncbi:TRAP transporter substrate-binding protein [Martelella sp. FOR1707]